MSAESPQPRTRFAQLRPLANAWRLAGLFWREQRGATLVLGLTLLAQGVIPALYLLVLGRFVDQIGALTKPPFAVGPAFATLALFLLLMAAGQWLGLLRATIEDLLRNRSARRLEELILTKAADLELLFFEQEASYDRIQRAQEAMRNRFASILTSSLDATQHVLTIAALSATLAAASPLLGPIVALAALPVLILKFRRTRAQFAWVSDTTPMQRRMGYFVSLAVGRAAAREVRLFDLGDYLHERWRERYTQYRQGQLAQARRSMSVEQLSQALLLVVYAAGAVFLAYAASDGRLSIGLYVVLIQAVARVQQETGGLLDLARQVYALSLFAENLFAFLAEPVSSDRTGDKPFPAPLREGIRLEDVWFRYPGSEAWVLKGISFEVPAGQTLSIVGRNGAGKSTLIKLLLGLYRPQRGRILFDGVPLEEIDYRDLRRHLSAVFQDFAKLELPLWESVGVGDAARLGDRAHIERTARLAGVDAIAARLEEGYEAILSKLHGHTDLSGGQWQKVAVARSLMRDAQVLVLDEPTASLDPRAELDLFTEFKRLSAGKTTFLISHRIGTARLAHRIVVIKDGQVLESGHHDQLARTGGEYQELFELQRSWYVDEEAAGA